MLVNVRGRDLVGFVAEAKAAVEAQRADVPGILRLTWGGQFENQQRAAARLAIVLPIALGMIFLLLYLTFGSLRQAILVFCNVPFATIGGIIALWASGEFLSVPASVGFIALIGIAVLNGVVMISYINEIVIKGQLPFREAVMEGARRRLRPVTLTATIAALGLMPFLFATGPGVGNSEAAGHCRDRRARHRDVADADPAADPLRSFRSAARRAPRGRPVASRRPGRRGGCRSAGVSGCAAAHTTRRNYRKG